MQIDSHTGARKTLVPKGAGKSIVEAVAVYARYRFPIFKSKLDEPNGATLIEPGKNDAEVTILDLPVLASLLFGNTRTGRPVRADAKALGIVESMPPPSDLTSFDTADPTFVATDDYGKVWVKRRRLGVVPTQADGSVGIHLPGGIPILLELYANAADKTPFATQREEMEFLPGERSRIGFRAEFFDSQCGGCHGSLSGREVDVHVKPDVLTAASRVQAFAKESDLFLPGPARGTPFGPGK